MDRKMFLLALATLLTLVTGQGGIPTNQTNSLVFTDTTRFPVVGNYTLGYINNTVQNRCHRAVAKFRAQATGIVDSVSMGVYSQTAPMTCGISFVLNTFPAGVLVGSSLLTTFTDLVAAKPGTDEYVQFNATPSSWGVVAGMNYTITILPFSWATGSAGTVSTTHCVFDVPYGNPGLPNAVIGQYGPTAMPCGSTPWTVDRAGDGFAMQLMLAGHPASVVVPSPSSSHTPTPTSTQTPTPSQTGTPTPSATPTGTPSPTDTPSVTPAPGSTPSNSATQTRTPSRTPSVSYTSSPTPSVTASITPTETPSPTPSLRIGASPSVTPTDTPGPTDSPSPTSSVRAVGAVAAGAGATSPQGSSAGSLVGAMVGGALLVLAVIGIAIRFRIVSAQINGTPRVASWRMMKKGKKHDFEIGTNPTIVNNPSLALRVERVNSISQATDV
jgi:hypothetical protein